MFEIIGLAITGLAWTGLSGAVWVKFCDNTVWLYSAAGKSNYGYTPSQR